MAQAPVAKQARSARTLRNIFSASSVAPRAAYTAASLRQKGRATSASCSVSWARRGAAAEREEASELQAIRPAGPAPPHLHELHGAVVLPRRERRIDGLDGRARLYEVRDGRLDLLLADEPVRPRPLQLHDARREGAPRELDSGPPRVAAHVRVEGARLVAEALEEAAGLRAHKDLWQRRRCLPLAPASLSRTFSYMPAVESAATRRSSVSLG